MKESIGKDKHFIRQRFFYSHVVSHFYDAIMTDVIINVPAVE